MCAVHTHIVDCNICTLCLLCRTPCWLLQMCNLRIQPRSLTCDVIGSPSCVHFKKSQISGELTQTICRGKLVCTMKERNSNHVYAWKCEISFSETQTHLKWFICQFSPFTKELWGFSFLHHWWFQLHGLSFYEKVSFQSNSAKWMLLLSLVSL